MDNLPPKHAVRATRAAGRQMRSRLLDAASAVFRDKGLAGGSIAGIAAAADAFPSQITYYFRTKEALFVEAACRDALHLGRAIEAAGSAQVSPEAYTRALVDTVMGTEAIGFFVEALVLTRRRPDLSPLIERTIARLHAEGLRAYAAAIAACGWRTRRDPDVTARRFWALAIGLTLEGHATGKSADALSAEMMRLLDVQADTDDASRTLRLVRERGPPAAG